jgi:predicted phage tail protein
MIEVKVPTGLPAGEGEHTFADLEWVTHRFQPRGLTVRQLLDALQIDEAALDHVVYNGALLTAEQKPRERRLRRGLVRRMLHLPARVERFTASDLDLYTPRDGEVLFVFPKVEGKNTSVILGVVGAVVGFYLAGPAGATWAWGAAIQGAMTGWAIGSTIGSLLTPQQRAAKQDGENLSTYVFSGITNEDRAGVPIPVVFGQHDTGVVRIGRVIRRRGDREYTDILGLVSIGPVESIDNVRLNDQPISNFPDADYEVRLGYPDQEPCRGFNVVANTYAQAQELTTAPYVYTTTGDVDALELLFTAAGIVHTTSKGEQKANKTRYQYRYRKIGDPWNDYTVVEVNRSTRATVLETVRIDDLERAQYEVEVSWLDADHTDDQYDLWKLALTGVTEELDDLRTYDGYALVAVHGVANEQLNGSLPNITVYCKGVLIDEWNGASWEPAAWERDGIEVGRVPAWIVLWLLRNQKVGLGPWINPEGRTLDASLDLASFKALADRNLTEVAVKNAVDFSTTLEPLHQFDLVLNTRHKALDLVKDILATCRAQLVQSGSKWKVVGDWERPAVQLFTMGNIVEDSFSATYQKDLTYNAHDVTYIDESKRYETSTVRVPYLDTLSGAELRARPMSLIGVTRESQAVREGRFAGRRVRRGVQFGAFTHACLLQAGDRFLLQHDLPQWGFGGTVMDGSELSLLQLDREVTIEEGKTYEVRVVFQDGTSEGVDREAGEVRVVADTAGTYNALRLTEPLPQVPAEGDIYTFGETQISSKPFECIAITRDGDSKRKVTAVEVVPWSDDYEVSLTPRNYSQLPNTLAPPPAITEATAHEEVPQRSDYSYPSTIIINWTPPLQSGGKGLYARALVEVSWDDGASFESLGYGYESYRHVNVPQGTHIEYRVTAISTRDVRATSSATAEVDTLGKTSAPPVPTNLTAKVQDGAFLFTWDDLADPSLRFDVRDENPADWSATTDGQLAIGLANHYALLDPAQRSYTIYVRSVDAFGNYSVGAANVSITDSAPAKPTITSVTPFKNSMTVKVSPPVGVTDIVAIHLHASMVSGFTPDDTTRVAGVVGPNGGEFNVQTSLSGTWYFKATCEDWLSYALQDWIYSDQGSGAITVIAPVDPTNVQLSVTEGSGGASAPVKNPDGTFQHKPLRRFGVTWDHTDMINPPGSHTGYEVIIYAEGAGFDEPTFQGIISDTSLRVFNRTTQAIDGATYHAAVKALYGDSMTSDFVTDTGVVVPQSTNPNVRTGDDRNITGYVESFDGASLPVGFTASGYSSISVGGGLAEFGISNSADFTLTWNLGTWADEYLDSTWNYEFAYALIRMKVDGDRGSEKPEVATWLGTVNEITLVDDDLSPLFHTYRVPIGDIPAGSSIVLKFPINTLLVGGILSITAIAIAAESFDTMLDGPMDRAQRARDQFGKDPTEGGFWLESPMRSEDDDGNITLVDRNGITWVRTDGGAEVAYKRGRKIAFSGVYDGLTYAWDTPYSSTTPISEPVPKPSSINKARFVLEPASPRTGTGYIYSEVTCVDDDGFRLNCLGASGAPSFYKFTAPFTGLAGSTITEFGGHGPYSNSGADGWFDFAGRGLVSASTVYYRTIAWVKVTMPLYTRPNRSFYRVTFKIAGYLGGSMGDNPGTIAAGSPIEVDPISFRCLTDGKVWRIPILFGSSTLGPSPIYASTVKVDWFDTEMDDDAPVGAKPASLTLDAVETHYAASPYAPASGLSFNMIYLEEF